MGCCGSCCDDEDDILDNVVVETRSDRAATAPRTSRAQAPQRVSRYGSIPRTYMPQVPRTYVPQVPKTYVPQVPRTYVPQVPKTYVPQVPKTYVPQVPKTYVPQVPKTYASQVLKTYVPQVPKTVIPKVPKTVVPKVPRTVEPQVPNIRPAPTRPLVTRGIFASLISAFPGQGMFQDELDGDRRRHWEENRFFQIFFSAMDNKVGYKGILRRWEKESQEAMDSGEHVKWSEIWQRKGGYINTLDRIRDLVQAGDKRLALADQHELREWAGKVVSRRKKQYEDAQQKGKADPKHLKALETWKQLDKAFKSQC